MKPQQQLNLELDAEHLADEGFIPDLCQLNAVFFLLVLTQVFAVVIAVIVSSDRLLGWEFLGLLSMFCHAIVLSCAALTCQLRPLYEKLPAAGVVGFFLAITLSVTALYGWLFIKLLPNELNATLFLYKSMLITAILSVLALRYFYLQHQWRVQKQAELKARLQALQARIRPHFLFNSMNSIAGLIGIDPEKAEDAILDLSELFRATLNNQKMLVPLSEELGLCKRYLNIEGLRLGERLTTEWDVASGVTGAMIPPLSLQPLFENAIYHGIQPRVEGGCIKVQAYEQKDWLYILISNPSDNQASKHKGNHIALDNIRSRLSALFAQRAVIKTSFLDGEFTVTLRLPMELNNAGA